MRPASTTRPAALRPAHGTLPLAHPPAPQTWQGTLPRRFSIKASYGLDAANNVTVLFNGLCMGPAATCRAQLEASLAPGGALAAPRSLPWRYQEDTYLAHAVRGIGWEVPDGYTPLQAVASPEAWKQERSYYK